MKKIIPIFGAVLLQALFVACASTGESSFKTADGDRFVVVSNDENSLMYNMSKSGGFESRLAKLENTAKKSKNNERALASLARHYLAISDFEKARSTAKKVLRLNFKNLSAKIVLAHLAFRQGRLENTKAILKQIPKKLRNAEVANLKALLAIENGDDKVAISILERANRKFKNNEAIRYNLGILKLRIGKVVGAQKLFQAVLKTMPSNRNAMMHLAVTFATQGKFEAARMIYETVQDETGGNPVVAYNLVVLDIREKKFDTALESLNDYMVKYANRKVADISAFTLIKIIEAENVSSQYIAGEKLDDLTRIAENADSRERETADEFAYGLIGFGH